ncbi:MAG: DUF402 domain-containing protein [Chloroflexi bacterium]|nr:DUF402 domain-containing protein [Chloroflexota bacterium]
MTQITVVKCDSAGVEIFRYPGKLLSRQETKLELEARFQAEDNVFHEISFNRGDRFLETYYTDRWYNIYEIHDRADDRLKGWYCNVSHPAIFEDSQVTFRDLALDLLVFPGGRQLVLDEDEFALLKLPESVHTRALEGLKELQQLFRLRNSNNSSPE